MTPIATTQWRADHREVDVAASGTRRVLVVPESVNRGWTAHAADGTQLEPITVNGWQQGWLVPAGTSGRITLEFASNTPYRVGLFGGLALLPVLLLLAFVPRRRPPVTRDAPGTWQPGAGTVTTAVLAMGFVISGVAGVAVVGLAVGARYLLRDRPLRSERVTLGASAIGLTVAGAVLSQYPWRSVDGYIGHAWGLQLLALLSVAALAASLVEFGPRRT